MKIIKFASKTCHPCKLLDDIMLDMKLEYDTIYIDEDIQSAIKYQIRTVPIVIKLDETNKELSRFSGIKTKKEIQEWIDG